MQVFRVKRIGFFQVPDRFFLLVQIVIGNAPVEIEGSARFVITRQQPVIIGDCGLILAELAQGCGPVEQQILRIGRDFQCGIEIIKCLFRLSLREISLAAIIKCRATCIVRKIARSQDHAAIGDANRMVRHLIGAQAEILIGSWPRCGRQVKAESQY